jgi:D-lyxose ketol-isomerase
MAITRDEYEAARAQALAYFAMVGIVLTEGEKHRIEVADFGLGSLQEFGVQLITYVDTQRVGAKEVVLLPGQTVPEHRHPPVAGGPGKEETFRCRFGTIYLYVDGPPTATPQARVPEARREHFTVWHEVVLQPGDQYTVYPEILHWFQAGTEGAVISEFSTPGTDEYDRYTDPGVARIPEIRG